jgi:hypothetical protein
MLANQTCGLTFPQKISIWRHICCSSEGLLGAMMCAEVDGYRCIIDTMCRHIGDICPQHVTPDPRKPTLSWWKRFHVPSKRVIYCRWSREFVPRYLLPWRWVLQVREKWPWPWEVNQHVSLKHWWHRRLCSIAKRLTALLKYWIRVDV